LPNDARPQTGATHKEESMQLQKRWTPVRKLRVGERIEIDGHGFGTVVTVRDHETDAGQRMSLRVALDDATLTENGELVLTDLRPTHAFVCAPDGVP
jgi:hypothetical protein